MAEGDGLGRLQMGEARHDGVRAAQAPSRRARFCKSASCAVERVDGVAHPQPDVGRDLVVARAGGVKPPGGGADELGSRLSTFMWMSSSARENVNVPASISAATA